METTGNHLGIFPLLSLAGLWDRTWVVRCGSKCLSLLISQFVFFLFFVFFLHIEGSYQIHFCLAQYLIEFCVIWCLGIMITEDIQESVTMLKHNK